MRVWACCRFGFTRQGGPCTPFRAFKRGGEKDFQVECTGLAGKGADAPVWRVFAGMRHRGEPVPHAVKNPG